MTADTYLVQFVLVIPDVLLLVRRSLHVEVVSAAGQDLPPRHHPLLDLRSLLPLVTNTDARWHLGGCTASHSHRSETGNTNVREK